MLTITNGGSLARALSTSIDSRLKRLLIERRDQLGGKITDKARFVIVQPGDGPDPLEAELSFSPFQNPGDGTSFGDPEFTPGWEWIEDHGHCFEVVFIFDDSGFAHVVLIEKSKGVDLELLKLCELHVTATV